MQTGFICVLALGEIISASLHVTCKGMLMEQLIGRRDPAPVLRGGSPTSQDTLNGRDHSAWLLQIATLAKESAGRRGPRFCIEFWISSLKGSSGIWPLYQRCHVNLCAALTTEGSYSYAAPSRVGAFEVHLVQGFLDAMSEII